MPAEEQYSTTKFGPSSKDLRKCVEYRPEDYTPLEFPPAREEYSTVDHFKDRKKKQKVKRSGGAMICSHTQLESNFI